MTPNFSLRVDILPTYMCVSLGIKKCHATVTIIWLSKYRLYYIYKHFEYFVPYNKRKMKLKLSNIISYGFSTVLVIFLIERISFCVIKYQEKAEIASIQTIR